MENMENLKEARKELLDIAMSLKEAIRREMEEGKTNAQERLELLEKLRRCDATINRLLK